MDNPAVTSRRVGFRLGLTRCRLRPHRSRFGFDYRLILASLACSAALSLPVLSAAAAQEPVAISAAEQRQRDLEAIREGAEALQPLTAQLKRVARFVRPSVVHIEAHKIEGRRTIDEAGSGVISRFDNEYYVITNRHVIKDAPQNEIRIRLDNGVELQPAAVWSDVGTDVAVLYLGSRSGSGGLNSGELGRGLVAAELGDSDAVEIGDLVLAVGSPFGLAHSITYGIISAKSRRDLKLGVEGVEFQNFFQTDAAINPGNSGGPLVNLRGEVIGINTAIASNSGGNDGIGFTIPINLVADVARQLIQYGNVQRAFLGVILDSDYNAEAAVRLGLPRAMGARVKDITDGSAAARSELRVGDIILEFDGVRIDDDKHLVNQVKVTPLEKEVRIVVLRDGKSLALKAVLASRAPAATRPASSRE